MMRKCLVSSLVHSMCVLVNIFLNVQSGRVVRALAYTFLTSKGQSSNPLRGTSKFRSMDIVKLDAVQLYNHQRSNMAVGVLVH